MVGVPLWALAHLRIEGDGIPGEAAVDGYYLIFEIFLRPALTIFGMMASFVIFTAMVYTLNDIYDLATANVGSFEPATTNTTPEMRRGSVDEFFFTVLYAIIVYMVGMSSFKLIDLIPNNILRWMGQQVMTFNDQREDSAQGMVGTASVGAQQGISALGKGLGGAMHTVAGPK